MFKVESAKQQINDSSETREVTLYSLTQNGEEIKGVRVSDWLGNGNYEVDSYNRDASVKLSKAKITDFTQNATSISLNGVRKFDELDLNVQIQLSNDANKDIRHIYNPYSRIIEKPEFNLQFSVTTNLNLWSNQFSYNDYKDEFISNVAEVFKGFEYLLDEDVADDDSYVVIYFKHEFSEETIEKNIELYIAPLENCHEITRQALDSEFSGDSVLTFFDFPEKLKVPCKQYLLYFAQFLQDLGIDVTSNLKEEAGKVLFSVTPTDDIEALDKIREALAVYLNLPSSPIVYDDSFAAMRLKQQIDSLKHSQQMAETEFRLRMAQSLVEAQNKTIADQSGMIVQQATLIQQQKEHIERITNPAVMIKSAENREELEEIYEGVKVGESEILKKWLGVSLNPAKAIKSAVKNTFGKNDGGSSILGLDEES